MLQTAVILAGGFGTRLKTVVNDVPKPMAPVLEKPFLHYQLQYLKHFGIQNVIFSVGYLHEKIENYFGEKYLGLNILYAHEETPMGTGGGIRLALLKTTDEHVLVLNGDSFFDCDLKLFYQLHTQHKAEASLALRMIHNADRFGTIETNQSHRIISFKEKTNLKQAGMINAGVYILTEANLFNKLRKNKPSQLKRTILNLS